MTEIILGLTIFGLLLHHTWYVNQINKEKNKLINSLVAKNADELAKLEFSDKTEVIKAEMPQPDLTPMEDVSDDEFDKIIKKEIE